MSRATGSQFLRRINRPATEPSPRFASGEYRTPGSPDSTSASWSSFGIGPGSAPAYCTQIPLVDAFPPIICESCCFRKQPASKSSSDIVTPKSPASRSWVSKARSTLLGGSAASRADSFCRTSGVSSWLRGVCFFSIASVLLLASEICARSAAASSCASNSSLMLTNTSIRPSAALMPLSIQTRFRLCRSIHQARADSIAITAPITADAVTAPPTRANQSITRLPWKALHNLVLFVALLVFSAFAVLYCQQIYDRKRNSGKHKDDDAK